MQVLRLAKIRLAEDFLSEGGMEMGPLNLEIHKICAILVKSAGFTAIWPNKILSGEFRVFCRNGHYLVKSTSLTAVRMNKFLSGEFRVFRRNGRYLVKSVGLAAVRTNKFLSGEFHVFCGNGHYLVKSTGLAAVWTNKFLSGEFCVFRRKVVIIGFGHRHGDLAVN